MFSGSSQFRMLEMSVTGGINSPAITLKLTESAVRLSSKSARKT